MAGSTGVHSVSRIILILLLLILNCCAILYIYKAAGGFGEGSTTTSTSSLNRSGNSPVVREHEAIDYLFIDFRCSFWRCHICVPRLSNLSLTDQFNYIFSLEAIVVYR